MTPTSRARFIAGYFELLCGDLALSSRDRRRLAAAANQAVADYYQQDSEALYNEMFAHVYSTVCQRPMQVLDMMRHAFEVRLAADDLASLLDSGLREAGVPELIAIASAHAGEGP